MVPPRRRVCRHADDIRHLCHAAAQQDLIRVQVQHIAQAAFLVEAADDFIVLQAIFAEIPLKKGSSFFRNSSPTGP